MFIRVFYALYICPFLEVWVIIVNYKRSYILLGKGKVIYCFFFFVCVGLCYVSAFVGTGCDYPYAYPLQVWVYLLERYFSV